MPYFSEKKINSPFVDYFPDPWSRSVQCTRYIDIRENVGNGKWFNDGSPEINSMVTPVEHGYNKRFNRHDRCRSVYDNIKNDRTSQIIRAKPKTIKALRQDMHRSIGEESNILHASIELQCQTSTLNKIKYFVLQQAALWYQHIKKTIGAMMLAH